MPASSGMPLGSGIWVMIPATRGSAWSDCSASPMSASVASAAGFDQPVLDTHQATAVEDLVEVHRGRGILAHDHDGERRSEPVLDAECGHVGGDLLTDHRRHGPSPQQAEVRRIPADQNSHLQLSSVPATGPRPRLNRATGSFPAKSRIPPRNRAAWTCTRASRRPAMGAGQARWSGVVIASRRGKRQSGLRLPVPVDLLEGDRGRATGVLGVVVQRVHIADEQLGRAAPCGGRGLADVRRPRLRVEGLVHG